jgi:hypothetical protein
MKKQFLIFILLLSFAISKAQEVIPLYDGKAPNAKAIAGLTDTTAVFTSGNKVIHFILRVASPNLTIFLPRKVKLPV